jgi:hypothetical protein
MDDVRVAFEKALARICLTIIEGHILATPIIKPAIAMNATIPALRRAGIMAQL